ncbi:MAG: InlB B-repeat-containing protein [Streptococcaceae bacterium]|jgi:uncharacterized repeat protein (TIGR02543 family)|nr:InlB B-repeat-containing protein [Streptococcaceae bacterium]
MATRFSRIQRLHPSLEAAHKTKKVWLYGASLLATLSVGLVAPTVLFDEQGISVYADAPAANTVTIGISASQVSSGTPYAWVWYGSGSGSYVVLTLNSAGTAYVANVPLTTNAGMISFILGTSPNINDAGSTSWDNSFTKIAEYDANTTLSSTSGHILIYNGGDSWSQDTPTTPSISAPDGIPTTGTVGTAITLPTNATITDPDELGNGSLTSISLTSVPSGSNLATDISSGSFTPDVAGSYTVSYNYTYTTLEQKSVTISATAVINVSPEIDNTVAFSQLGGTTSISLQGLADSDGGVFDLSSIEALKNSTPNGDLSDATITVTGPDSDSYYQNTTLDTGVTSFSPDEAGVYTVVFSYGGLTDMRTINVAGLQATDPYQPAITGRVSAPSAYTYDPSKQGVSVVDPTDSSAKPTVIITDNDDETLTPLTANADGTYSLPSGGTADEDYTKTYTVEWQWEDSEGNLAFINQTISVIYLAITPGPDQTVLVNTTVDPKQLSNASQGLKVYGSAGNQLTNSQILSALAAGDLTLTVYDPSGNIVSNVSEDGTFKVAQAGKYTVTYTYTDPNTDLVVTTDPQSGLDSSDIEQDELQYITVYQTYTVFYDANGGKGAPDEAVVKENDSYTLSSKIPTRAGYKFIAWAGSDGKSYQPGSSYPHVTANLTLKAQWEKLPVSETSPSITNPKTSAKPHVPTPESYKPTSQPVSLPKPETPVHLIPVSYNKTLPQTEDRDDYGMTTAGYTFIMAGLGLAAAQYVSASNRKKKRN